MKCGAKWCRSCVRFPPLIAPPHSPLAMQSMALIIVDRFAWHVVGTRMRQAGYQWKKGVNGHALFGLSSKIVMRQMEMLPGIQDCAFYKPIAQRDSANADASPSHSANGSAPLLAGGAGGGAGANRAKLLKLQETYLQKQEQLMQRLEFERKREEAKERQRLEKERHKVRALMSCPCAGPRLAHLRSRHICVPET